MSYNLIQRAGLYGRDLKFFINSLQQKLTNPGKRKAPIIICNSYPKSGTHLLYQILYSIPELQKWNDIVSVQALCGVMNSSSHIRWKISSAPDSSIVRSHLMHCTEICQILDQEYCRKLFIYRDLRDVAVSHARWIVKESKIFLHPIYIKQKTFEEQLMSSIKGTPLGSPFGSNLSQPDIGQDFLRWKGWIDDPNTLAIKFEDLVGERGGEDEDKRMYTIEKILKHLKIQITHELIQSKFTSTVMNPQESHTFQKGGQGSTGNWKKYFTSEHKSEFKKVAGEILIDLGYETDLNW
jgi:sulfotransferase 6B1